MSIKKIAIDIRNIGKKRTGDEVVFFNLVKQFSILDKENEYFLLTDRNPETDQELQKSITSLCLAPNFKVISLCERGANKFWWNAWMLPKYLRENPADILQVQYITPFFVPRKIKIITIVHDISFKVFPELVEKTDLFFLQTLIPLSLRRADKIIGVSRFTADEIMKYYKVDKRKIGWIHNAVADNFFVEHSQDKLEAVRQKYNLPEKFILYIGTLQPRKNLPALIETYVSMPMEKRKNIKLVLAGGKGKNYDTKIDDFIRDYSLEKYVLLPGYIADEDKPLVIKLAHVFCLPSMYEGFGIPILEAMTAGVPVLASNITPHAEITAEAALLFNLDNPADFSQKLMQIVDEDSTRTDLIKKGLLQSKKFSWQQTAEKMLGIYRETA
ncbi:MAG: hypothetical protein COX30_00440 [Candidatus Moranbacteria bacterium CG23_combo_of_CG06-09_8_20_14_all_39_10]|nr:MAG: hypothetical protein COX30_00440 [Candidatus Moranbacteria bacterium CG23_combo_of_CG06-09_8_20_14_all_39_10]